MAETPRNFGAVDRLQADAIGPPGRRTFRLVVSGDEGTAALWMDKEELQALGVATEQFLARLTGRLQWKTYGTSEEPYEGAEELKEDPQVEFKVGQLSLGYESETSMFVLMIHDADSDPTGPATFSCLASMPKMRELSRRIASVVSAGRPRCRLCGDPMEADGHFCVRAN